MESRRRPETGRATRTRPAARPHPGGARSHLTRQRFISAQSLIIPSSLNDCRFEALASAIIAVAIVIRAIGLWAEVLAQTSTPCTSRAQHVDRHV